MKKERGMLVNAVIAAAGKGTRMNTDLCKQYIGINGIPMLARTIQAFEDCSRVDAIILVINEKDMVFCKREIIDAYGLRKVKILAPGGAVRQESVYNGLLHVDRACDIVLVHDGARPFIGPDSIMDSINAAEKYGAACVAVPVKDTVKEADSGGFVRTTLDRSALWSVQTPQAFKYELLAKAYENARETGFTGTDDAVLVERLGYRIRLVTGNYFNIKITTKEDLVLAEAIARIYDGNGRK